MMKYISLAVLACIGVNAFAQEVHFDYNRSANFGQYKTYQWVNYKPVDVGDQLLDQDIKRAVDAQLAGKGLRRVDSGGDLVVGYQAAVSEEKQYVSFGSSANDLLGPFGNWGDTRVTTSTIEVCKLVIGLFDPAVKQLMWRGLASKALDIKKDPNKNYRVLERAVAKLFRNYPPTLGKTRPGAMLPVCHSWLCQRRAGLPDNTWMSADATPLLRPGPLIPNLAMSIFEGFESPTSFVRASQAACTGMAEVGA